MSINKITLKIESILDQASKLLDNNYSISTSKNLSKEIIVHLDTIISVCESRKAILTVLITLIGYKHLNPNQDIRNHQANLPHGFSGRTFDTQIITPFMKKHGFPAMVESGWLTRSLEQNKPYNLEYPGKITPIKAKSAFLSIIDSIESNRVNPKDCLLYLFQELIKHRESHKLNIVVNPLKDKKISIDEIVSLIEQHFMLSSKVGKARLPVLALYSIYESMIHELNRYNGKYLKPLESHTSADNRSGEIGDINVLNKEDIPFEAVEVKYEKPITAQMILDAYKKFKNYPVTRYYLLSTKESDKSELTLIKSAINYISKEHGCQIIVNGVMHTLKYYLRLINNTDAFLERYAFHVSNDDVIKFEHKNLLNELIKKRV
jgi:DNA (cytosine-5)-methyltransferase 1